MSESIARESPSESVLDARTARLNFLRAEISVGLTFVSMAKGNSGVKAERSRVRARAAYDTVVRYMDRMSLMQEEREQVLARLDKLKKLLQALGERF